MQLVVPAIMTAADERLEVALQSCCRDIGVESLKEHQREAIVSFVDGNDVLVCLPTGYGKSLCFAVLPLVFDYLRERRGSIVICVSPLTSLMMEQKSKFTPRGLMVDFVGEMQHDLKSIENVQCGRVQLLYISPESILRNPQWRDMLLTDVYQENLVAIAVDEAHCIARW